jgi:hypothetical protein
MFATSPNAIEKESQLSEDEKIFLHFFLNGSTYSSPSIHYPKTTLVASTH